MIRIELRPPRKRRWLPAVLLVALIAVVGALATLGVAFREYLPDLGKSQVAIPTRPAAPSSAVDADSIPLVFAPARQDTVGADTARPTATSPVGTPAPAKPVLPPPSTPAVVPPARAAAAGPAPAPVVPGVILARMSGSAARRSTPCTRTLDLCSRLPVGVRLTALACDADGVYSLEGVGAWPHQVEAFLDTLREAGSQATLSWWSDGPAGTDGQRACRFTFRGQPQAAAPVEVPAVSAAQAAAAFSRVAALARLAGLAGVSVDSVVEEGTTGGRQRQRFSATGSPEQIGAFLNRLRSAPVPTVLTEVAVTPPPAAGPATAQTRLTAAVEATVLRP